MTEAGDGEREALAFVIEQGWGNPTWDGKTLRPIDRQIADAVLAAGFRRTEVPGSNADERPDVISAASAAFKARGGAPDWEEDAIARDLIIRWHLRGFEDGLAAGVRSSGSEMARQKDTIAMLREDEAELHRIRTEVPEPPRVIERHDLVMPIYDEPEPQGEPSEAALDAAFAAFRAHERGEEFNELSEHVCSECGYAYSWPSGADGRQEVPPRRRQRHIAREALRAGQFTLWLEPSDAQVQAVAAALDIHRWKTMGVASVQCECGEVIELDPISTGEAIENAALQAFPADAAFRLHMARAALRAAEGVSRG